jgi:hypothetical protein
MVGPGTKLRRKQEEAIAALLSQPRVEDAARTVGVPVRTVYRWMREPEFAARYKEARRAAFGQCTARLQQMSAAAVSWLTRMPRPPAGCEPHRAFWSAPPRRLKSRKSKGGWTPLSQLQRTLREITVDMGRRLGKRIRKLEA